MPRSSSRPPQGELLQGTLPLLILRIACHRPNDGFAMPAAFSQISKAVLRIEQGSLLRAHRMELDGVIESDYREQSEGKDTDDGRMSWPAKPSAGIRSPRHRGGSAEG
jgi:hypothetical protein